MQSLFIWLFLYFCIVECIRTPDWDISENVHGRFMYYAPSIIGQDPHVSKIDIYSDFFTTLHERDLRYMQLMGVTHVVVSENWSTAGTNVHDAFLNLLKDNGLKLVITYALPMRDDGESITPDKSKFDFESLMKEWTEDSRLAYTNLLWGFFIPTPDTPKMSTVEVGDYYALVNQLKNIAENKLASQKISSLFIAGMPFDPKELKLYLYPFRGVQSVDYWCMDIYDSDFNILLTQYSTLWQDTETPKPLLLNVKIDSWDATKRMSNFSSQALNMSIALEVIIKEIIQPTVDRVNIRGAIINEYSDEWWRSDLADVGYSEEGCPNGNPFAHTPCGITTHVGILSLEFVGLFSIKDRPLGYCVEPKQAADVIFDMWSNQTTTPYSDSASLCAPLPFVFWPTARITYYFYPVVAALGLFTVFSLFCFATKKKPREEKERDMPGSEMPSHYSTSQFPMHLIPKEQKN